MHVAVGRGKIAMLMPPAFGIQPHMISHDFNRKILCLPGTYTHSSAPTYSGPDKIVKNVHLCIQRNLKAIDI